MLCGLACLPHLSRRYSPTQSLYGLTFEWLVARLNEALRDAALATTVSTAATSQPPSHRMMERLVTFDILDIFGFERHEANSFEQARVYQQLPSCRQLPSCPTVPDQASCPPFTLHSWRLRSSASTTRTRRSTTSSFSPCSRYIVPRVYGSKLLQSWQRTHVPHAHLLCTPCAPLKHRTRATCPIHMSATACAAQAEESLLEIEGVVAPPVSYSDNSECLRMLDSHLASVLHRAPSPAPSEPSAPSRSTSSASVASATSLTSFNPSLTEWKLRRNTSVAATVNTTYGGLDPQARETYRR